MRKATIGLLAVAALAAAAFAQGVQINSSIKDGDILSGIVEVRVIVTADATVNQVEFYVNGELRATDTSTPYTFLLDTIPEKEGPLNLEIAAYTAEGDSERVRLGLTVDNGLDKGAEYHLKNAQQFLNVAKYDDAIRALRVALKADENFTPAKLALGRAYLGKGVLDEAQRWAEEALFAEESVEAHELLSGIHVNRAFRITSTKGETGNALKEIGSAFKAAVAQKHAALDLKLKALGPVTDENRLQVVDLLIQKNEYSAARRHLLVKWDEYNPINAIANRLIFASMRSTRMEEAHAVALAVQENGAPDVATLALLAAGHAYFRHWDQAGKALRDGTFADPDSPILMSSAAFIAHRRREHGAMLSQINSMIRKNVSAAEMYYYLAVLQWSVGQYTEARDNYRRAIVQNPLLYDAYVQRGYESLWAAQRAGLDSDPDVAKSKEFLLEQAREYMEVALAAKPDSPEALNGLAIVYLYQEEFDEALRIARAAADAGAEYAFTHFTLGCALSQKQLSIEARKAVDRAGALDTEVLRGFQIPSVDQAWNYTIKHGRLPVLIAPR
ncbi:MAG: hypothetical protein IH851_11920 [Armatimonadetes bacterium]|nr:hypothetical protein [Armatimonadota bacterium]